MTPARRPASGPAPVVAIAIAAFAVAVFTLYPGFYTFDSAYQLYQARTGEYHSLQPPTMTLAWAGLLAAGLPPGSLLVVHLAALCAGAALIGLSLPRPWDLIAPLVLLWPPFLALFGHLLIDVSLAASLLLATGWIAWTRATGRAALGWWAAIPLAYAVGVRHNALLAVPPLLFLLLAHKSSRGLLANIAIALGLTAAAFAAWTGVWRMVAPPVPAWSSTAIWDLSAVSVASGELLLPPGVHGPGLTVEELRPLVNSYASMTILTGTRSGINAGLLEPPLPEAVKRELMLRWVRLPFTHGKAWLRHRLDVAWSLFGVRRAGEPEGQFIEPIATPFRDNPPIRKNETVANDLLLRAVQALHYTPWTAPIAYLALSIFALALALRAGFAGDRMLVGALVLGTWLFALPLVVLVPAADWRYALWPMVSAVVALLLALGGASARDNRFHLP
jgi:hypothetical protein